MNWYNEIDPKKADWLRELIRRGIIADGVVDERSIVEVRGAELSSYAQCHFFAGIGGWSYALRLAGWPDDEPVDTGSCPCQPFSCAGRLRRTKDPRHLWSEFRRIIAERRPAICFGEQVASKAGRAWLAGVRRDLEALAYAVGGGDLCAAGAGAPHIRQRIYWVGDTSGGGLGIDGSASWRAGHADLASTARGVADAQDDGHARRHDEASERFAPHKSQRQGAPRGLGHANLSQCDQRPRIGLQSLHDAQGGVSGMGDANREGCARQSLGLLGAAAQDYWTAFDELHCTDGKTRRIEPGTFPLADGVPARMGRLRGYGDAIVPEIAAQFIAAYIEARGLRFGGRS